VTTPDPMDEIFAEYTDGITAATDTSGADRLWRKAKRRRTGRVTVAGVAAVALTGTATWAFQQAGAAEEQETANEQAAEQTTAPDETPMSREEERYLDMLGAGTDLVGAELDLPSFVPGNADVDAVCGRDDVVLADGRHEEPLEPGAVFVKESMAGTLAGDGGGWTEEVGLFGCRYGEETLYQAVVLAEVEKDRWEAREQIVHSIPGGESPQYLQSSYDDGILIGFAERYDPAANDLAYWIESVGFDAEGAPVRDVLADLDGSGCSDLSVRFTGAETEESGVWTVTLEIRNNGPRDITDHVLHAAVDEGITILSGDPVDVIDPETWTTLAEIEELGVGEVYTEQWTATVTDDRGDTIPPAFHASLEAVVPWEERSEVAQTVFWGQEGAAYYFWE
jgi:hypothetical protein